MKFVSLQKMFKLPEGDSFWMGFNDLASKLVDATEKLSLEEFANLHEPPEWLKDSLLLTNELTRQ